MFYTVLKASADNKKNKVNYDEIEEGVQIKGTDSMETSLQVAQKYKEETEKIGYKAEIVKGSEVEKYFAYWSDEEVLGCLDKDKGYAVHIKSVDGDEDKTVFFLSYSEAEIKKAKIMGKVKLWDVLGETLDRVGLNDFSAGSENEKKIDEAFLYASYERKITNEQMFDHFLSEYFWDEYDNKLKEMHERAKKDPTALKNLMSRSSDIYIVSMN